jgi:hypothetical protein
MCEVFTSILVRNQGGIHDFLHHACQCGNVGGRQRLLNSNPSDEKLTLRWKETN